MQEYPDGRTGQQRLYRQLQYWSFYSGLTAASIAFLAVVGWEFNIRFLKNPLSHQVLMNPLTALSLLACGIAFLLLQGTKQTPGRLLAGRLLAGLAVAAGVGKLCYLAGITPLAIDELLYTHQLALDVQAGFVVAMAPNTAVCLCLTGAACWLGQLQTRGGHVPAQYLALLVSLVAYFSVLGYLYRVHAFYGLFQYVPMAIHTAIFFLLLSMALLLAIPARGFMNTITGMYIGSVVARLMLPAVIIVPALLGWLRLQGYWYGLFSTEFGVALLVLTITLFVIGLIWYTIHLLNTRDREKAMVLQALQQSEEDTRYQALLLQNISDVVISTDATFRVVSWNGAAAALYGWTASEVAGKPVNELIQPIYPNTSREEVIRSYLHNGYWKGEVIHHKRSGEQVSVLVSTTLIRKGGINEGTVAVIRDITAWRRAERNFRDLLNAAPDATVIVDQRGQVQMVNKRVEELFGYSRNECLGEPVELLLPGAMRAQHQHHVQRYMHEPRVRPMGAGMELQARKKDGTLFPVEISLSPLETAEGLLVSASIRDITERREIEQKLKQFNEALEQQVRARTARIRQNEEVILATNDQLRRLTAHLEDIREQERLRISREIHDELGQQLTGLKMDIAWLARKAPAGEAPIQQKFAGVLLLLDEMVTTVRRISTELRPAVLDDLGLLAAIEWHSAEFEKRFGIAVHLLLPEDNPPLPADKATALFRVYQEALTNVARHAGAQRVTTCITVAQQRLAMSVSDDGQGFDLTTAKGRKTLGLLGMEERVHMIGGSYDLASQPGKGTEIKVTITY